MANDVVTGGALALDDCEDIRMTPLQCNAVIEEKLSHLQPLLEETLNEMEEVRDALANGGISWKSLLNRAMKKNSSDS